MNFQGSEDEKLMSHIWLSVNQRLYFFGCFCCGFRRLGCCCWVQLEIILYCLDPTDFIVITRKCNDINIVARTHQRRAINLKFDFLKTFENEILIVQVKALGVHKLNTEH